MKKSFNVLVVEDDEYYNNLLSEVLKQRMLLKKEKWDFNFTLRSFTDAGECINKIKSGDFVHSDSIAFIDYYLGNGINGTHIIKILKEQLFNTTIVLISQSKSVRGKVYPGIYDFFVLKDKSAPALCCLCLDQYLDNNFYIPLD